MFWKTKNIGLSIIESPNVNLSQLSYHSFYKQFKENNFLFSCVSTFVSALCSLKLVHTNHNIGWKNFIQKLSYSLLITGNAYIDKNYNIISTTSVSLLTDKNNHMVSAYKIKMKSNEYIVDKNQILHIKLYNPNDQHYGLSPVEPAMRAIETHNAISDFFLAVVQNGGRPSGILSHADCYSDNIKKSIKDDFKELYRRMGTQSAVAILEGTYKWESIGIDPDKLKLLETKVKVEREIALVFGIPPILVGVSDATFSNYREARKHFIYERVITTMELILENLNKFFNAKLSIDYQDIEKELK